MKSCPVPRAVPRPIARHLIAALSTATALLVSACGGGGSDAGNPVVCTTEVRASVVLTVVDAASAPIPSAVVSYQINGGPAKSLICPATGACAVEYEQAGQFTLSVSKLGFVTTAATVQVNRDACHVLTEQLRVVLRTVG